MVHFPFDSNKTQAATSLPVATLTGSSQGRQITSTASNASTLKKIAAVLAVTAALLLIGAMFATGFGAPIGVVTALLLVSTGGMGAALGALGLSFQPE